MECAVRPANLTKISSIWRGSLSRTKVNGRSAAMDEMDRAILSQLSQDARMSVSVLARRLKLARSTVQA
ncbi:AsnC family transcriptional regulator, partial [Klebsiella pneumoniae]